MNILHMKYAYEVARAGSLSKAAEVLLIAGPNISRSIKELEADLGITIFERTTRGMSLTPEGEEFMQYAKGILSQIDEVERIYREGSVRKQKFSISVPRAGYISQGFANFTKLLQDEPLEVFYKETNLRNTINAVLNHENKLGIIRYAAEYDKYFKNMLDEKGLVYELVAEFTHVLMMSENTPLASKPQIAFDDLQDYIEVSFPDPYGSVSPVSKEDKIGFEQGMAPHIYVYERGSELELLSINEKTFMWAEPAPADMLAKHGLVQRTCAHNSGVYKDMLIYRKGYKLSELDNRFITELCLAKRKVL